MTDRRRPDDRDRERGAELRRLRKSLGFTQAHVAERVGLTPQQISKYERGLGSISVTLFEDIMAVLHGTKVGHFAEDQAAFGASAPGIKTSLADSIARMQIELDNLRTIVSRL